MAEYIDRERLKEVFDRNVVSAGVFNDIIDAQPTADVIPIPEGATNGDMIKTMFPNGKEYDNDGDVRYEIEIDFDYSYCSYFDGVWWNAPYKKEVEE